MSADRDARVQRGEDEATFRAKPSRYCQGLGPRRQRSISADPSYEPPPPHHSQEASQGSSPNPSPTKPTGIGQGVLDLRSPRRCVLPRSSQRSFRQPPSTPRATSVGTYPTSATQTTSIPNRTATCRDASKELFQIARSNGEAGNRDKLLPASPVSCPLQPTTLPASQVLRARAFPSSSGSMVQVDGPAQAPTPRPTSPSPLPEFEARTWHPANRPRELARPA